MIFPAEDNSYFRKFNLVRDPFPLDVIDKVLYLTPELNRRLELLVNRIKSGGPVQVVISPQGGGKTVLAEYLASLKEPDWLVGQVQGEANQDKESLSLAILNKIFPDHAFEKGQAVSQLQKLLEISTLNGKIPVFIIDDAHELSPDCLAFMLQLAALRYDDSSYRIVLFANESINDRLDKTGVLDSRDGVLKELNLPPLSSEQIQAYIENRLALSGGLNGNLFSATDMAWITRISAGLPGGVNLLARQVMQQKLGGGNGRRKGKRRLLIAAAGLAVLLLATGYYFLTQRQTIAVGADSPSAAMTESQPAGKDAAGPVKTSTIEQQLFAAQVSLDLPHPVSPVETTPDNHARKTAVTQSPAATAGIQRQESRPASAPVQRETGPGPGETNSNQSIIGVQNQDDIEVADDSSQPADSHEDFAPDNIYRLDSVPDIVKGIHGPDWFRQQAPDLFVLQILSVSEFANLERVLKKIPELQGQLSGYTNYTPSGMPRYLLYYGLYQDRQTANAAVRDIPTPLQAVKPWPRDIKSIINQLDGLAVRGYY